MSYRITTLVENTVYGRKLQGEHGLSLFIETSRYKILFDTGASDLFIRNARLLGIDLTAVDYLILSHGHSDHTGGLRNFLKLNAKAFVVCKPEILWKKYKENRENGIKNASDLDLSRFQFVSSERELVPGICLFPDIPIFYKEDTHFDRFFTMGKETVIPDTFHDEMAVALYTESSFSILSSCSHRGITNIARVVQRAFPALSCNMVLGGFHIHNAEEAKYHVIADYFMRNTPSSIGICHCTGVDKYALFRRDFGERVFYNYTGKVVIV